MIIAIDGPAGSGKSTLAKALASELGLEYLDTGGMYRIYTLKLIKEDINFDNTYEIEKYLDNLNMNIENDKFYLDNADVTEEIRSREVSDKVSVVAVVKKVREKMVELQRKMSESKNIILDGRDIGTVVFPNADLKIYLIADVEERARRRYSELKSKGDSSVDYDSILKNIESRDQIDSNRKESPLTKAADAVEIDTSNLTIKELIKKIKKLLKNE